MALYKKLVALIPVFFDARKRRAAEQIAIQSQAEAWQRSAERAVNLRAAEARGYLRARAAAVIARQAGRVAAEQGIAANQQGELIQLATSEVLRLLIRQWVEARPMRAELATQRHAA